MSAFVRADGLKENFPFSLLQDPCHDSNGVCDYALTKLLTFFKTEAGLTADELNSAVTQFRWDGLEKHESIPVPTFKIAEGEIIAQQTTAQMLILVTRLPFVLNFTCVREKPKVFSSEQWRCHSLLVKVLATIFSPVIHLFDLNSYSRNLEEFLRLYVKLYGDDSFKNKFHHFLHYVEQILRFGNSRYDFSFFFEYY